MAHSLTHPFATNAQHAGVQQYDAILQVNNVDCAHSSHQRVIGLIKSSPRPITLVLQYSPHLAQQESDGEEEEEEEKGRPGRSKELLSPLASPTRTGMTEEQTARISQSPVIKALQRDEGKPPLKIVQRE